MASLTTAPSSCSAALPAHDNAHLAPWAYRALGLLMTLAGLAVSAVLAWFFVLGLQETEADPAARTALAAAGVLLSLIELLSFAGAGLLPARAMRGLRRALLGLGATLLAFEVAVMAVTQLALVGAADAHAGAQASRVQQLQQQLASRRATVASLRELAASQGRSVLAASRESGAQALRQAIALEAGTAALAAELAQVQAAQRPTLTTLLGAERTAALAIARSALIGLAGLLMTYAGGALFRAARGLRPALPASSSMATRAAAPAGTHLATVLPLHAQRLAGAAALAFGAGVPAVAAAASPAPTAPASPAAQERPATAPEQERSAEQARATGPRADSGTEQGKDTRYQHVAELVRAGTIRPSSRAIKATARCATEVALRYLAELEREGITRRTARGFELARA